MVVGISALFFATIGLRIKDRMPLCSQDLLVAPLATHSLNFIIPLKKGLGNIRGRALYC